MVTNILLALSSAGSGSSLTLALCLHLLYYLGMAKEDEAKDRKLRLAVVVSYAASAVLAALALWFLARD